MNDDARPGLDDGDEARTRLMTRRLARSDSSPILVIPVTSRRLLTPVPGMAVTLEASSPSPKRRTSVARLILAAVALIAIGACAASVYAGARPPSAMRGNGGTPAKTVAPVAPSDDRTQTNAIGLSVSVPQATPGVGQAVAIAAPPTTGVPNGASRPPVVTAAAASSAAPAPRRATRRTPANAEELAAAALAASTRPVPASAASDELVDAQKTARLASDEVAAALH
jgi:hypothetical protein